MATGNCTQDILTTLTAKLNPSGGASYHESSASNKSAAGIPGLFGHFTGAGSTSRGSVSSTGSIPSASCGCGNIINPASNTKWRVGHQQKENLPEQSQSHKTLRANKLTPNLIQNKSLKTQRPKPKNLSPMSLITPINPTSNQRPRQHGAIFCSYLTRKQIIITSN